MQFKHSHSFHTLEVENIIYTSYLITGQRAEKRLTGQPRKSM